ncbi:MAG: hypothetical protein OXF08_06480 [Bacteroidetes bacterium]|nr:hypothetical protein [Bacteroidota bacterium]
MDSVFRQARREALHIVIFSVLCMIWTIGYCGIFAYNAQEVTLIWGIPHWVIFGVALPWLSATVYSLWFALIHMKEKGDDSN